MHCNSHVASVSTRPRQATHDTRHTTTAGARCSLTGDDAMAVPSRHFAKDAELEPTQPLPLVGQPDTPADAATPPDDRMRPASAADIAPPPPGDTFVANGTPLPHPGDAEGERIALAEATAPITID